MAKQTIDNKTILTVGAVALGAWVLYKPIKALFDTLGVTQSETQQMLQQQQTTGVKSPFSPLYWRQFKKSHILTQAQADAKAAALNNAITYTGPNFQTIIGVFKSLQYKTQVSYLADYFARKYKTDLLEYLQNGKSNFLVHNALREAQLNTILTYVNNLKIGNF